MCFFSGEVVDGRREVVDGAEVSFQTVSLVATSLAVDSSHRTRPDQLTPPLSLDYLPDAFRKSRPSSLDRAFGIRKIQQVALLAA
eukprot:s2419_g5.t1